MRTRLRIAAAVAGALAVSTPALAFAEDWKVDTGKSLLVVLVHRDKKAIASGLSHDHVVQATGWTASLSWDPDDPEDCKLSFEVPAAKLAMDPPELRKRFKLKGSLDEGDREKARNDMLGGGVLDAKKHPQIAFEGGGCKVRGKRVVVDGKLTLHGKSVPVQVTATVRPKGDTLRADARFYAKVSSFGIDPPSAMGGLVKTKDQVTFVVELHASR